MKTIVGLLDDYNEAQDLVDDLVDEGFSRSSIDIVKHDVERGKEGKGFLESLKNFFSGQRDVPETEREYYYEGVRRGGVLVSVAVEDIDVDRAIALMNKHDAIDIEQRAAQWKETGWTGFNEKLPPYGPEEMAKERETVLPVMEEKVKIGKRQVSKGGVRVYSRVIETPIEEKVSLHEERAKIERRPVDRPVRAGEEAFKESTIEIKETAEEPVVSKETRVKEEVVVGKQAGQRTETIREKERHTEVDIEGIEDFRKHFQTNYASLGDRYEMYDPAYRYAGTLFSDERYMNKDWSLIESDVRKDWEMKHPGTWDKFKGAIHHGFDRMRGRPKKAA